MSSEYLVLVGSFCLVFALVEAWMLVASLSNPNGGLVRWVPGTPDLLRSHIDYLMMAMLLYIFYGLFAHFQLAANAWVVGAMCIGSIGNPLLFLVRAIKPSLKETQTPLFRAALGISCVLTTIGYLGAALMVAGAAWSRLS